MIVFSVIAAVMLAAALLMILPPLMGRLGRSGRGPRLETGPHREKVAALRLELERGALTQAQFESARDELARAMLADLERAAAPRSGRAAPASPATILGVAILVPVASVCLYAWLGSVESLRGAHEAVTAGAEGAHGDSQSLPSVEQMVDALAQRLREHPDDGEGWLMLARSYTALERYAAAAEAFAKAHALLGDRAQLLVDYADVAAAANGNDLSGLPRSLIDKALAIEPENRKGLWLAGFAALQGGDGPAATRHWNRLLGLMPPGSDEHRMVREMIVQAGGEPSAEGEDVSAAGPAIHLRVRLAPELQARVSGDETLFVFARALEGPPMPLAIQRLRAGALPLETRLDDSMHMLPSLKLSGFPRVAVGARISRSGNATPQSGDLEGSVSPVEVGTAEVVDLTIERVVP